METIIKVDDTHRIKVYPVFDGDSNFWRWYIQKQTKWLFWWLSSSWEKDGSILMKVFREYKEEKAIEVAEQIKREYLSIINKKK